MTLTSVAAAHVLLKLFKKCDNRRVTARACLIRGAGNAQLCGAAGSLGFQVGTLAHPSWKSPILNRFQSIPVLGRLLLLSVMNTGSHCYKLSLKPTEEEKEKEDGCASVAADNETSLDVKSTEAEGSFWSRQCFGFPGFSKSLAKCCSTWWLTGRLLTHV